MQPLGKNELKLKKSALLINDLSVYSKSSLEISYPIVEAMGVEASALPTVVLSTQTDGFDSPIASDTSEFLAKTLKMFSDKKIVFDGIYIGYLHSLDEFDIVLDYLKSYSGLVLLDPVLGDNGAFYSTITEGHLSGMKRLLNRADIITPNLFEAKMLFGIEGDMRGESISDMLQNLFSFECYIKGFERKAERLENIALAEGNIYSYEYDRLMGHYPGMGDIFASIVFSMRLRGKSVLNTLKYASNISTETMRRALSLGRDSRLGIDILPALEMILR